MSADHQQQPQQQQQQQQQQADKSHSPSSSSSSLLVTLTLLALAKDARYVHECQRLLHQILLPWILPVAANNRNDGDSGESDDDNLSAAAASALAALASSGLYAATVLRRQGRTAGMEAVGLEFGGSSSDSNRAVEATASLVTGACLSAAGVGALQLLAAAAIRERKRRHSNNNDNDSETIANWERQRGAARRRVFERQREAMRRRAEQERTMTTTEQPTAESHQQQQQQQQHDGVTTTTTTTTTTNAATAAATSMRTQKTKFSLVSVIETMIQSWSSALAEPPAGPHEIFNSINSNSAASSRASSSVAHWIMRLHLALFCCNGRFPTLLHRFLWHRHPLQLQQREKLMESSNAAAAASSTVPRIVGLLIVAQAAGTAVNALSRQLVHWWVDSRGSSSAWAASSSSSRLNYSRRAQDDSQQHSTEEEQQQQQQQHLPSGSNIIRFEGLSSSLSLSNDPQQQCAICRQPRRHAACSVHCGHVFCWNCWQQWIATNVPACPLCRKPCRANEIMLLHGY